MKFETAQILEIAGVSKDTLRHWKSHLPPLAHRDGRSDRYSLAELLVVCVVARATRDLGVAISHVAKGASRLFQEAEERLQGEIDNDVVCFLLGGECVWAHSCADIEAGTVIRVKPILDRIRAAPDPVRLQLGLPLD